MVTFWPFVVKLPFVFSWRLVVNDPETNLTLEEEMRG